jgi:flagellar export protein FliJ
MAPTFSLQSVLEYRHSRVEVLEVQLGGLIQTQKRGITFLETLKDSQGRIFNQLNECQQGDLDLFLLSRLRSSLKVVKERITHQQEALRELSVQVESKRDEVITAKQGEEALVKLKDKEIERYQLEQAQEDIRQQDDIYNTRAYQRSSTLV